MKHRHFSGHGIWSWPPRGLLNSATTGSAGDGKIFVSPVDEFLDIGSKQSGERAIDIEGDKSVVVQVSR
jgi:hypothetical protein